MAPSHSMFLKPLCPSARMCEGLRVRGRSHCYTCTSPRNRACSYPSSPARCRSSVHRLALDTLRGRTLARFHSTIPPRHPQSLARTSALLHLRERSPQRNCRSRWSRRSTSSRTLPLRSSVRLVSSTERVNTLAQNRSTYQHRSFPSDCTRAPLRRTACIARRM